MKKILYAVLVSASAVVSCQKSDLMSESQSRGRIHARIERLAATRTSMDECRNVLWSEEDKVTAFMKSTSGTSFRITEESIGKTTGSFEEVASDNGGSAQGNAIPHNVAYYPGSPSVTCSLSGDCYTLSVNVFSEQTYAEGSFGNGTMPMAAVSETDDFNFLNVFGAMKIQLKGKRKVASVRVEGRNGEKLSGAAEVKVCPDGTKPSVVMSELSSAFVTLDCGEGVQLGESASTGFLIALPPVEFSNGFKVTVTDMQGNGYIIETSKKNTVYRSSVLVMPAVTLGEPDIPAGESMPDYIDENGISQGRGIGIDGVIWAPVNCGYHETDYPYGKLYQWGRKYGQGYSGYDYNVSKEVSDAAVPEIMTGGVSLEQGQSEENADLFFLGYRGNDYDWLYSSDDTLWNSGTESEPLKTEYDPCPNGWRVPTYAEMDALFMNMSPWTVNDKNQKGYWFCGSSAYSSAVPQVFFPAAGSRYGYDGYAYERGSFGFYWSSGTISFNAYYFLLLDGTAASGSLDRSEGYSVRCVKEW